MRININNTVKVRLTSYGDRKLKLHYKNLEEELNYDFSFLIPEKDENGYQEFQLWSFMNIFGEYMYNGSPLIIENNAIIIE